MVTTIPVLKVTYNNLIVHWFSVCGLDCREFQLCSPTFTKPAARLARFKLKLSNVIALHDEHLNWFLKKVLRWLFTVLLKFFIVGSLIYVVVPSCANTLGFLMEKNTRKESLKTDSVLTT